MKKKEIPKSCDNGESMNVVETIEEIKKYVGY